MGIFFLEETYDNNITKSENTMTGVILETEGSVWKIQKRALFHYKTVKKGTPTQKRALRISPYEKRALRISPPLFKPFLKGFTTK